MQQEKQYQRIAFNKIKFCVAIERSPNSNHLDEQEIEADFLGSFLRFTENDASTLYNGHPHARHSLNISSIMLRFETIDEKLFTRFYSYLKQNQFYTENILREKISKRSI
jgi:hypothetical protein